jgi:glycosyltransferase involved in cell wall biosynthesis
VNDRLESLRLRWDRKEDVDETELAELRNDADPAVRALAARVAFEQAMRPALDAIAGSLAAEARWDTEAEWVARGAQLARYDEPVPYMLKELGLAAIQRLDLDQAITMLFNSMVWAMRQGQSGDPRSRRLMRYALDPDFDAAYEAIAARMSMPRYYTTKSAKKRVAVLIPFDRDGNSVGLVSSGITVGLCERGIDAFVVTTRMLDSPSDTLQRKALEAAGSRLIEAEGQSSLEKTMWLLDYFEREPVDAVLYISDPQDVVPRLCEIIGLANAQIFMNAAYEHRTGRLDAVIETVEPEQVARSLRPDIATFIPTGIVRDRAIIDAAPANRAEYKAAEDAVILTTFGRLSKLAQRGFLEAVTTILQTEPKAVWMLAGAGNTEEAGAIHAALKAAGVEDRIIDLGARAGEIPALLKMSDVYLDPFPFPGAQSTGEAMFASLPVVSMQRASDEDLDPTQTGPTTAAGEAMIGDAAPMAPTGDVAAYVALARRYISDVAERKRAGAALRERADAQLTWSGMIDGYRDAIERAIEQRTPLRDGELSAIFIVPSELAFERVIARITGDRGLYAASRIVVVINGPHPDLELRAKRYGDRLDIVRLASESDWAAAARAGIEASQSELCVVLDGSNLPFENWTAEGVAQARRCGYGHVPGGVVVARANPASVDEALRSHKPISKTIEAPQTPQADASELLLGIQDRHEALKSFSDSEIAQFSAHADSRIRALGKRIDFENKSSKAFQAALDLAVADETMADDLIGFLSGAASARHPAAYVAAMKLRARRSFASGNFEDALKAIGTAMHVGMSAGQMGVKRWHSLLHVANDPEFDELLEAIAAKVSPPRVYPARSQPRRRFAVVVSVDLAANSLSLVASRLAIGFRALGHDVVYVSTEFYKSPPNMPTAVSVEAAGGEVIRAEGQTFIERTNDLLDRFSRKPADAVLYVVDPSDPIARVLEIIGLASAQALMTAGFDQRSGRIDTFIHTVQAAQLETALHPERSVFIPTGIARDRELLSARPVLRSDVDFKPDDIVLCTVGRLNKSVQRDFLDAIFGALNKNKRLKWLVLGPREDQSLRILDRAMGVAGVGGQVQWPGAIHERLASYIRSADIYCDTFPFPGGQSLGEAMFAGIPIVAMRKVVDSDLDPTGTGPTSATAEVFIGDAVELVPAGDVKAYTERILKYVADPELRKRDGARLRERAIATLGWDQMVRGYASVLEQLAEREVAGVG